jgi:hypothetical protein
MSAATSLQIRLTSSFGAVNTLLEEVCPQEEKEKWTWVDMDAPYPCDLGLL